MKESTTLRRFGNQWYGNLPNITRFICSSSNLIMNMIQSCDMFRLQYCNYYIRWYVNGNKGKLTVTEVKSYGN